MPEEEIPSLDELQHQIYELRRANGELQQQVQQQNEELEACRAGRRRAENLLLLGYDELERRVEERTARLQETNAQLRDEIAERQRVEGALRTSEAGFRSLVEQSPFSMLICTPDGRPLLANKARTNLWNITPDHFASFMVTYNLLNDQELIDLGMAPYIQRALAGEAVQTPPTRMRLPVSPDDEPAEAEEIWVLTHLYPVKDEMGKVRELVLMHQDISERKKAELALRESEEKFRTLAQQSPNMVFINCRGSVVYANECAETYLGYTEEEFLAPGFDFLSLIAPESKERVKASFARHGRGEEIEPYEYALLAKDGTRIESIISTKLVDYEGEKAILGVVTDITERKRAEERLRQYTIRLEALREIDGAILATHTPTMIAQVALRHLKDVIGFWRGSVVLFDMESEKAQIIATLADQDSEIGSGVFLPISELDAAPMLLAGETVVRSDTSLLPDLPAVSKRLLEKGIRSYIGVPLLIQGKLVGALYLSAADVDYYSREKMEIAQEVANSLAIAIQQASLNERLRDHAADLELRVADRTAELQASETRYRSLFENTREAIFISGPDGKITSANPAAAKVLGLSDPESLIGLPAAQLYADPDMRAVILKDLAEKGYLENYEVTLAKQDGSGTTVELLGSGIIYTNEAGEIERVEGMHSDITERKRAQRALQEQEELLSNVLETIDDGILVLDSDFRYVYWNRAMERLSGISREALIANKPAWKHFPHLEEWGVSDMIKRAMRGEITQSENIPFELADGRSGFTSERFLPLKDAGGKIHRIVGVVHDVTEQRRKEDDLRAANERLKELDGLKSKFIADVTHELRTPVANLNLYLDLLERGSSKDIDRYLSVLKEQGKRLMNLVTDTLDLSRLDVSREYMPLMQVEINHVVQGAVLSIEARARSKGLKLRFIPGAALPPVFGDQQQLGQMTTNLLLNAINYTGSGEVRISTYLDSRSRMVGLVVQDAGMGLDPEELAHCFDPFYRGHRVGQLNIPGSGLGLALAKEIVDLHDGRIEVKSAVGEGSTFTVWLPTEARPDE